jgi:hypothetical protein
MAKYALNYLNDGEGSAVAPVTLRIAISFVGVLLFNLGIVLNVFELENGYVLIIGALLMPVGVYLSLTTKGGCSWQRRLALASLITNIAGTIFVIWLLSTATINRAT